MADKYSFTDYNAMVGKRPRQTYWKELQDAVNAEADITAEKVDKVVGKQLSTEDYTSAEKTKLSGIQAGAQVNVGTNIAQGTRTATTVPITSSTGSNATLDVATASLAGVMSSADKTKLNGIATGAQVNTVTSVATKTGAVTLVKGDVGLGNVDNVQQIPMTQKGANNGVATLDATGNVPTEQLGNAQTKLEFHATDPIEPEIGSMWIGVI